MPHDDYVATFFAEASLLIECVPGGYHFYDAAGSPLPRTVRAGAVLRGVLSRPSAHPFAHHLYLHLVEPGPTSTGGASGTGRMLPSAAALAAAFNGTDAQHLLHMPTHAYLRTGRYAMTVPQNLLAHAADE